MPIATRYISYQIGTTTVDHATMRDRIKADEARGQAILAGAMSR